MSECQRLGCNHAQGRHEPTEAVGFLSGASGCLGVGKITGSRCLDCSCTGFSTKTVDAHGLRAEWERFNPGDVCKPRPATSPSKATGANE